MAPGRERARGDPRLTRVVRYWRANGLKTSTIAVYRRWVRRFHDAHVGHGEDDTTSLDRETVVAFAKAYARTHHIDAADARQSACVALHAWSMALAALGVPVSRWAPVGGVPAPVAPLVREFAEHQRRHRGLTEPSLRKQQAHVAMFSAFLHRRRRRLPALRDVDAFVAVCARRYARVTVADVCSSLRAFLRFLHATARLPSDLASSIMAPLVRRGARPPRALPWADVCRLLRAVDRSTPGGRRDFALLLLMATYGLGAGEATSLTLEDIDWRAGTLRVTRPKTGRAIVLPLLATVARALAVYLRQGRPRATRARHVFVQRRAPYGALRSSSAVRHVILKHARAAGLSAAYLGSHVLRHSHATRQINAGVSPTIVADILGHRDPTSTSAYARVALDRLREVALPVPAWP